MVYNPMDREVKRQLKLPLYYTGLTDKADISEQGGESKTYQLDRRYNVEVPVRIGPGAVTWFLIR